MHTKATCYRKLNLHPSNHHLITLWSSYSTSPKTCAFSKQYSKWSISCVYIWYLCIVEWPIHYSWSIVYIGHLQDTWRSSWKFMIFSIHNSIDQSVFGMNLIRVSQWCNYFKYIEFIRVCNRNLGAFMKIHKDIILFTYYHLL